ncbi:MAG: ethanolamine ammonia-lyase subunit EutC [Pseudomonadota bacterium]|jgi:ethanolamine ammonia-lyase small subunit
MNLITPDPWSELRSLTPARIALGRTGASQPTEALLAFGLAHAQARDAVHTPLQTDALAADLEADGWTVLRAHSRAPDRAHYLRRPDLGRRLNEPSVQMLRERAHPSAGSGADHHAGQGTGFSGDASQGLARGEVVFVVADGLSATAVQRHARPMLQAARSALTQVQQTGSGLQDNFELGPVVIAQQARVALGDEVGECLGAQVVVLLVGERPGLSSPDSLGIYLTWAPRVGRLDSERNCISNIRPEGLPYTQASAILAGLLAGARRLGASGIALKDETTPTLGANSVSALASTTETPPS